MSESPVNMVDLAQTLRGRRVLVTGHTGFKGGWLCLWLAQLGAKVTGIALPPPPGPSLFGALRLEQIVDHRIGDIRSPQSYNDAVAGLEPELVVHLAAQALVRPSYQSPVDTYLTNAVGTAVVLDNARHMASLKGVIIVTSDKCYENHEWPWPYRENDALGGADPYSSSKGCAEIVTAAMRRSYFSDPAGPQIASVRAGNVFGGGDWAVDRLVPDIVRAIQAGTDVDIRNPHSVRPWQHVLEPLSGYLTLAAKLVSAKAAHYAQAWNFGPDPHAFIDVESMASGLCNAWGTGAPGLRLGQSAPGEPHEAGLLTLDSSKARARLGWQPRLSTADAIAMTADWYRAHALGQTDMRAFSEAQIDLFANATTPEILSGRANGAGELKQCA